MPFDPGFTRTLEALNLLARRLLHGEERGDRTTPRRGASLEFADYRRYTPGDEIRYIDWNVYARHGSLFVKEFTAEEDVHIALVLDTSRSMTFGRPTKLKAAEELAAAIGYIGLANFDTVSLYSAAGALRARARLLRGKGAVFELLSAIEELEEEGAGDLAGAFGSPIARLKGRSLVVLISDFYDPGASAAVRGLLAQRHQVHLVHLVSREEIDPPEEGRVRLVDLESGRERDVVVGPRTLAAYRRRFVDWCSELEAFALRHELFYARVRADDPLEKRVRDLLRRGGILEHR